MEKPDSHEGSSGDAGGGTDGNVGERKACSSGMSCGSWGWLRPGCVRPFWNPRRGRPEGQTPHESSQFWSEAGGH